MIPDGRTPRLLSVFFPSLSRDILWKRGAVSRVRSAAQKPRALDTAPTFQQDPPGKQAKGRSSEPKPRDGGLTAAQTQTPDPVDISLLRAKNGLDGGHFSAMTAGTNAIQRLLMNVGAFRCDALIVASFFSVLGATPPRC